MKIVFVFQSSDFEIKGKENYTHKLNKTLYSFHQSGRIEFLEIHKVLKELSLIKYEWCNCVYSFGNQVLLLLYVDNILFRKTDQQISDVLKVFFLKRSLILKFWEKLKSC